MPHPRLSVVLITKDEEDRIEQCLSSTKELGHLLHEVCVYDTGSTDETVAIARRHGAKVAEGYWDDDFARARNAASDMASGDWLLRLDADEAIRCSPHLLEEFINNATPEPDGMLVLSRVSSDDIPSTADWRPSRIYKRELVHHERPIHETLARRDGKPMRYASVPAEALRVLNTGFDDTRMSSSYTTKLRMLSDLIERQDPDNPDFSLHLDRGRALAALGRREDAISDLRAANEWAPQEETNYTHWSKELLITELVGAELLDEAETVMQELSTLTPGRSYTYWVEGSLRTAQGDPARAFAAYSQVMGGLSGGLQELPPWQAYQACLTAAAEEENPSHIISSLLALVSLEPSRTDYFPLFAHWWGSRPVEPLAAILYLSCDVSVEDFATQAIHVGGDCESLGERLLQHLAATRQDTSAERSRSL